METYTRNATESVRIEYQFLSYSAICNTLTLWTPLIIAEKENSKEGVRGCNFGT